ncbi:MAG: hypothetical protein AB8G17_11540 [Gammaproteobacteria bacterium]
MIAIIAAFGTTACDTLRPGLSRDANDDNLPLARALDLQILELHTLSSATYQERIDTFRMIELDYVDNPSDANRLRLALAKSVEGHPSSNLDDAFRDLNALLGEANTLSPTQVRLASKAVRDIESNIIMNTQLGELRARVAQFEQSNTAQSSRDDRRLQTARNRLRELEEDNLRLTEELDQAQRQLDAIMSIETSSDPAN